MPGGKTKAISLKARRFQKYQLFLSFSAHNYEIYFRDGKVNDSIESLQRGHYQKQIRWRFRPATTWLSEAMSIPKHIAFSIYTKQITW